MNETSELQQEAVSAPARAPNRVHRGAWLLTLCLAAAACNEPGKTEEEPRDASGSSTQNQTEAETQNADGVQSAHDGDGNGGVSVEGTKVTISLPRDTSRFPPGPDFPLADGTPCLACHDQGEVAEFTAERSPNLEVVNEVCRDCHSADYVTSQPRLTKVGWQKVVTKMADKFATSTVNGVAVVDEKLNPTHQALMVDYLTAVNGK